MTSLFPCIYALLGSSFRKGLILRTRQFSISYRRPLSSRLVVLNPRPVGGGGFAPLWVFLNVPLGFQYLSGHQ